MDGIVTIRDLDWEKLAQNYIIPEPIAHIDHTPIKSKNGKSNNGYTPKKNGLQDLPMFIEEVLVEQW